MTFSAVACLESEWATAQALRYQESEYPDALVISEKQDIEGLS
jgi:hypothetical protein